MFRPTSAQIHLDRLVHNAKILKAWSGADSFFCPMVKANAYGHGASPVALALFHAGFQMVGVALIEEAIQLRRDGYQGEILVFGPLDGEAVQALEEFNLTPVLSRWADLQKIADSSVERLHVKFNTGMNRLGFPAEDAKRVSETIRKFAVRLKGICTHLSQGFDADELHGNTQQQLKLFAQISNHFPGVPRHCLNSAALQALLTRSDSERAKLGARPGIALYGLPSGHEEAAKELQPVLQWSTQIDVVQNVKKGQSVSYGGRWTAPVDSIIGIVPVGYADGYFRSLTNQAQMLFGGQRVNVVGTVCMDYTLLDLTQAMQTRDQTKLSDEVVIIGQQGAERITAVELARKLNTVSYEIVTNISARVPRVFVEAT